MKLYQFMLEHMEDEHRFQLTSKISQEVIFSFYVRIYIFVCVRTCVLVSVCVCVCVVVGFGKGGCQHIRICVCMCIRLLTLFNKEGVAPHY